ncbi:BPI fold-containing family B member 2 [Emydura macquarii macquarii]|uniref:BPI fold-containing family B member 2 n=1 Tax=Emydura macquarii macquarii TaxID=1129001 RepID=UPI00352AEBCD
MAVLSQRRARPACISAGAAVEIFGSQEEICSPVCQTGRTPLQQAIRIIDVPDFTGRKGLFRSALNISGSLVPVELTVGSSIQLDIRVLRSAKGFLELSISACKSVLSDVQITLGILNMPNNFLMHLRNHLCAILVDKLCVSVSSVVLTLNGKLRTLVGHKAINPVSQLQYSMIDPPVITKDYIDLDLNNSTTDDFTTSLLGSAIPTLTHLFPKSVPVGMKVVVRKVPVVTLDEGRAILRLSLFVWLVAPVPACGLKPLFALDVDVSLALRLAVMKVNLQASVSLIGEVGLALAFSSVGPVDVSHVKYLIVPVFEKIFLDHLNATLSVGLTLPTLNNLEYVEPSVKIHKGYAVVNSGLSYQQ